MRNLRDRSIKKACRSIMAAVILHNMLEMRDEEFDVSIMYRKILASVVEVSQTILEKAFFSLLTTQEQSASLDNYVSKLVVLGQYHEFWTVSRSVLTTFSHEPRLYERVCPSICWSVGQSVTLSSVCRDKTASGYCHIYKLVLLNSSR